MKLITKKTDYAIRAFCYMAKEGKIVPVTELVENLKIPRPFLRGILQELEKKKLVKSFKGRGGGFKLSNPPDKIFLTQLIKIFQGPIKLTECIIKKKVCPDVTTCLVKKKMEHISKYIKSELEPITIASLLH